MGSLRLAAKYLYLGAPKYLTFNIGAMTRTTWLPSLMCDQLICHTFLHPLSHTQQYEILQMKSKTTFIHSYSCIRNEDNFIPLNVLVFAFIHSVVRDVLEVHWQTQFITVKLSLPRNDRYTGKPCVHGWLHIVIDPSYFMRLGWISLHGISSLIGCLCQLTTSLTNAARAFTVCGVVSFREIVRIIGLVVLTSAIRFLARTWVRGWNSEKNVITTKA